MDNAERLRQLIEEAEMLGAPVEWSLNLPVRPIEAAYLQDLMTIFCWLDIEHQSRAVSALNNILSDQITELKGSRNTAI